MIYDSAAGLQAYQASFCMKLQLDPCLIDKQMCQKMTFKEVFLLSVRVNSSYRRANITAVSLLILSDPDGGQLDGEGVEERVEGAHRLIKVAVFGCTSSRENCSTDWQ